MGYKKYLILIIGSFYYKPHVLFCIKCEKLNKYFNAIIYIDYNCLKKGIYFFFKFKVKVIKQNKN